MTAAEVLAAVAARGLRIEADACGNPRLRGDREAITPGLLRLLKAHREAITATLTPPAPVRCPACGKRDLDARGICWSLKCNYRRCHGCGGNTGSQFIMNCDLCGLHIHSTEGWLS